MEQEEFANPNIMRLQKALSHAGIASRRASEILILNSRVKVNGKTVNELGAKIDISQDKIMVDGKSVQLDASKKYYILNKPTKVVCSLKDEHNREDLSLYVKEIPERVYNVGRLDYETSGLLLLTNDGELAHILAHPSFGVTKVYIARVRGKVSGEILARIRQGVHLEDGVIAADKVRVLPNGRMNNVTLVEIAIHSGRNRIVRRLFSELGHEVLDLVRKQFGPIHLGTLELGRMRELDQDEIRSLLTLARHPQKIAKKEKRKNLPKKNLKI